MVKRAFENLSHTGTETLKLRTKHVRMYTAVTIHKQPLHSQCTTTRAAAEGDECTELTDVQVIFDPTNELNLLKHWICKWVLLMRVYTHTHTHTRTQACTPHLQHVVIREPQCWIANVLEHNLRS